MKTVLVLLASAALSLALPQNIQRFVDSRNSKITKYLTERTERGYKFAIEQDDGQVKQEVAEIKNEGKENESLSVQGFYSYVGDDGKTYSVGYTADENGFQPEGEHLPPAASVKRTPPLGIPSAALASLAG